MPKGPEFEAPLTRMSPHMIHRTMRLAGAALAATLMAGLALADGTWLGTSYCQANPNSTGQPALIAMFGPDNAGSGAVFLDDVVILRAGPVPQGTVGMFIYGQQETQTPFGDGYLCITGQVNRLPVTSARGSFDSTFVQPIVFSDHEGFHMGDWKLQAWYRDSAGGPSGFNLTDGLAFLIGS